MGILELIGRPYFDSKHVWNKCLINCFRIDSLSSNLRDKTTHLSMQNFANHLSRKFSLWFMFICTNESTTKIAKLNSRELKICKKFRPNSLKYLYAKNMAYTVVFYIIRTQYLHIMHPGKDKSFKTNGYISNHNKKRRPRPKFKVSFIYISAVSESMLLK